MIKILLIIAICLSFSGCANVPLKDDELVIGKDTTAGLEGAGIASINRQF